MKVAGLSVIILLFMLSEINAFNWTSNLQDGADVYTCVGEDIHFPWSYSLDHGETVQEIKWYYHYGNDSRESIAAVVEGRFFLLSSNFSDKFGHTGTAGLSVTSLTGLDSGRYSVTVTVHRGSCFTTYNHTAILVVAEDPLVQQNEALWARQEDATVYDNTTGQVHVQVSCGKFVITGRAPVYVEWTLPSGEKRLVSRHINGTFFLPLANPVKGGNYTCRLFPKLRPVSCMPKNSSVFRSSSVSVDEVKVRLSLLEAEQEILIRENRGEIARLTEENNRLQHQLDNMTFAVQHVKNYLGELDSSKISFDVRLSKQLLVTRGRVILDNVTMNKGSSYNVSTGVFSAPFSGTYFFVIAVYASWNYFETQTIASLCDNSTCFCHVQAMEGQYRLGTCQAAVYRAEGQSAWLRSQGQWYLNGPYTSFTGFSVNADIQIEM